MAASPRDAAAPKITGLILAGGKGRRIGMRDKGLIEFRGRPLIAHVLERLAPQVDEVLVSANRHLDKYAGFGVEVFRDATDGFDGPLAGIEAGWARTTNDLLLSVPCDAPRLAGDLARRLHEAMQARHADVAVARTGAQVHPVFCLTRRGVRARLLAFLNRGGRKMDAWYAQLHCVEVAFDDEADAFANINTLEDLQHWEHRP